METKIKKKKENPNKRLAPELRAKEFVEAYLVNFNATAAYSLVFDCEPTNACTVAASAFLRTIDVQQYLQQRLKERRDELHVDQNFVVKKLLQIVETDYVDSIQYLTKDQINQIPKSVRPLIQSIELDKSRTENTDAEGNEKIFTSTRYKVTFMSKDKAIELLGKHTGAFMRDNVQLNADLGRMSFTDALKELDI